jgi:hypothetical protein
MSRRTQLRYEKAKSRVTIFQRSVMVRASQRQQTSFCRRDAQALTGKRFTSKLGIGRYPCAAFVPPTTEDPVIILLGAISGLVQA